MSYIMETLRWRTMHLKEGTTELEINITLNMHVFGCMWLMSPYFMKRHRVSRFASALWHGRWKSTLAEYRDTFYQQRSTAIMTGISNQTHCFLLGASTHPCPKFVAVCLCLLRRSLPGITVSPTKYLNGLALLVLSVSVNRAILSLGLKNATLAIE